MKGYELNIKCFLLQDIEYRDVYESLGRFLNYIMDKSDYLKNLHNSSDIKGYSFGSLTPYEKVQYRLGEEYSFKLRSMSIDIINEFRMALIDSENDDILVTDVRFEEVDIYSKINKLHTVTPTVSISKDPSKGKYWKSGMDIEELRCSIAGNLTRKYNSLNGVNIRLNADDIVKSVVVTTRKPMVVNYNSKKSRLLGFRASIEFQDNKLAQELAAIGYFLGICTKNSTLGCGFAQAEFGGEGKCY